VFWLWGLNLGHRLVLAKEFDLAPVYPPPPSCRLPRSFMMYLASVTRPDISFVVSKLSWFTSNPKDDHWRALERVMHYLVGTMDYGIHYSVYPAVLEGYSDTN
jgi:hypothetical protein